MAKLPKMSFESKLFWTTASTGLAITLIAAIAMWQANVSPYLMIMLFIVMVCAVLLTSGLVYQQTKVQFQTMTNLLEAVANGDYGLRSRQARGTGALAELTTQINLLADTLTRQHFEVKESQMLLSKVMSQINVAIFAWNERQNITLVNNAGCQLLSLASGEILGKNARDCFPDVVLKSNHQVIEHQFPGLTGRFSILQDQFMEQNHKHSLMFITNVQEMLRAEELKAWQNLIRVISHEINNSLVPISSLSQMLLSHPVVNSESGALQESLEVIAERANGLTEFVNSYRKLSKVPKPVYQSAVLRAELEKVIKLYPEQHFAIECNEALVAQVDPNLLQQVFINLCKNAIESQARNAPDATIEITVCKGDSLTISIRDFGVGISNPENLFVPFYSTKSGGSGIGLVLCRQIIEAHNGQLHLANHSQQGCIATISLPLNQ